MRFQKRVGSPTFQRVARTPPEGAPRAPALGQPGGCGKPGTGGAWALRTARVQKARSRRSWSPFLSASGLGSLRPG